MVECKFGSKCTKGAKCRFLHSKVCSKCIWIDGLEDREKGVNQAGSKDGAEENEIREEDEKARRRAGFQSSLGKCVDKL